MSALPLNGVPPIFLDVIVEATPALPALSAYLASFTFTAFISIEWLPVSVELDTDVLEAPFSVIVLGVLNFEAVEALPLKVAFIVPAEKFPLESLLTILFPVFEFVASDMWAESVVIVLFAIVIVPSEFIVIFPPDLTCPRLDCPVFAMCAS